MTTSGQAPSPEDPGAQAEPGSFLSRHRRLRNAVLLFALGLIYLLIVERLGRGIPCLFFEITGFRCPGCGLTRMFRALAHLDLARAFRCNAAAMVILPLLGLQKLAESRTPPPSERLQGFFRRLDIALLVLLLAFGAVRNLPAFGPYLNP